MSDSLRPHEPQHARPPCPSPTPGVYSNSCPSSRWCHPAISSSVVPLSSRLQSFPASGCFPMGQFFASGRQRIGAEWQKSSMEAGDLPPNNKRLVAWGLRPTQWAQRLSHALHTWTDNALWTSLTMQDKKAPLPNLEEEQMMEAWHLLKNEEKGGLLLLPPFLSMIKLWPTKFSGRGKSYPPACKPHRPLIRINHVLSTTLLSLNSSLYCHRKDSGPVVLWSPPETTSELTLLPLQRARWLSNACILTSLQISNQPLGNGMTTGHELELTFQGR